MYFRFLLSSLVILGESFCYSMEKGSSLDMQLIKAIQKDNISLVSALLAQGANGNSKDKSCNRALECAAHKGYWDICIHLLEKGAHFNKSEYEYSADSLTTYLHIKAENPLQFHLNCTLLRAAIKGDLVDAQEALDKGAHPDRYGLEFINNCDKYHIGGMEAEKSWPLYQAILHNHESLVKLLISCKASIKGNSARDALWVAIVLGHAKYVEMLLRAGATLNYLHEFVIRHNLIKDGIFTSEPRYNAIVRLLCIYGLLNRPEENGGSSFPFVFDGVNETTMKELLQACFTNPLEYAIITNSYTDVQKCLIEIQDRAQARSQGFLSYSLSWLKLFVPYSVRTWLVCSDAAVAYTQEEQAHLSRALMYAVAQNRIEIVKLLLNFGTDPFEALVLIKIILMREGSKCSEKRSQIYQLLCEHALKKIAALAQRSDSTRPQNYLQLLPKELIQELFLSLKGNIPAVDTV